MDNKPDLRVRRTYRLLTEAMIELMCEKSFEKITVIEICEKAMVHRATFYKYFEDKYQLLEYCIHEITLAFANESNDIKNVSSYKEYFLMISRYVFNEFYGHKEIYLSILRKNSNSYIIHKMKETLTNKMAAKFNEFKENGMEITVPTDMLANFYSGACINTLYWFIKSESNMSVDEIVDNLKKIIENK